MTSPKKPPLVHRSYLVLLGIALAAFLSMWLGSAYMANEADKAKRQLGTPPTAEEVKKD